MQRVPKGCSVWGGERTAASSTASRCASSHVCSSSVGSMPGGGVTAIHAIEAIEPAEPAEAIDAIDPTLRGHAGGCEGGRRGSQPNPNTDPDPNPDPDPDPDPNPNLAPAWVTGLW